MQVLPSELLSLVFASPCLSALDAYSLLRCCRAWMRACQDTRWSFTLDSWAAQTTNEALLSLVMRFPRIVRLRLGFCRNVTTVGSVIAQLPNLTALRSGLLVTSAFDAVLCSHWGQSCSMHSFDGRTLCRAGKGAHSLFFPTPLSGRTAIASGGPFAGANSLPRPLRLRWSR